MKEPYDLLSIRNRVRELLADALGTSEKDIAEDRSFFELGLTSRIGVQWMARVNEQYQLLIPAVRVYNYPTLEKLCGLIYQQLTDEATRVATPSSKPRVARFKLFGKPPSEKDSHKQPSKEPVSPAALAAQSRVTADFNRDIAHKSMASKAILKTPKSTVSNQQAQKVPIATRAKKDDEAMAVVGLSGRFPGARNIAEFWRVIIEGRDCISRVNRDYWSMDKAFDAKMQAGKTYSDWLGAIDGIDEFDPLFFNISPADAESMDPQQRLFLEEAWHCLEDAGYRADRLSGERCGVFVGCGSYGQSQNGFDLSAAGFLGASPSILSARIAYLLDLRGPCLSIDTACSSSLVAMAQACDSLNAGDCDLALVGGVSVLTDPSIHIMASQTGMLSADGRCFSFDQRANGFVPAEGVAVVALKRLSDALRDGDHIYTSIIGWGINQDGRTNGITAPSQTAQTRLQQSVFERFGINPRTIGLVEAHGSGTKLGDPLEVEALQEAFAPYSSDVGFCALGSVKSNVGHLLAAAGSAGFFKTALSLAHKTLPPSIHFKQLNEHINLTRSPFYVNTQAQHWPLEEGHLRRAAVSSFGFSGTNAYLVLEEVPQVDAPSRVQHKVTSAAEEVVVLSARTDERLQAYATLLLGFLKNNQQPFSLADIAYTLQVGRVPMDWRVAFIVSSLDALVDTLEAFASGRKVAGVISGCATEQRDSRRLAEEYARAGTSQTMAQLWVEDKQFDWSAINHARHQNGKGKSSARLISLPGYPFEQRRFVMPVFRPKGDNVRQQLTPLIHRNVSTLDYVAYRSEFNGAEFFFSDHVIAGRRTLPGVAVIESVFMSAVLSKAGVPLGLRNLFWMRPVLVEEGPVITEIRLIKKAQQVRFELYQIEKGIDRLCAQGELIVSDQAQSELLANESVILDDAQQIDDLISCYEKFAKQGFAYGQRFRNLQALYRRDQQMIGEVVLNEKNVGTAEHNWPMPITRGDGFYLHPGLLDSAFQPCIRFCEYHHADKTYIPFSVDEIHIYGSLPNRFYSLVTLKQITDESASFSLRMLDDAGRCLVHINDLTLRPVMLKATSREDCYFYDLHWTTVERSVVAPATIHEFRLFFLPRVNGVISEPQGARDIVIYPGEVFAQHDASCFTIRPNNADDYVRLWQQAGLQDKEVAIGHFWHLFDGQTTGAEIDVKQEAQQFEYGVYALTSLLQHLLRQKQTDKTCLFVFHGLSEQRETPALVGLGGFMLSFAAEQPEFLARLIGLDEAELEGTVVAASLMAREQQIQGCNAIETRYLDGQRQILKHARLPLPSQNSKSTQSSLDGVGFRHAGVYIIAGGAGGLGRLLANDLMQSYQACVVLFGRRPLNGELGGVDYRQVDMTDADAVQYAVAEIRQQYGRLNGVIHCAGVMDNAFLADRSKQRMSVVIEAKVLGARYLDEATKDDAMDIFLLYSSIASLMPFAGQTDYAFANRYLDSFAAQRNRQVMSGARQGVTLAVNWSLWQEGGMTLDEPSRRYLKHSLGLEPLQTEQALNALKAALGLVKHHSVNQLAILSGDLTTIESNWRGRPEYHHSGQSNSAKLDTAELERLPVFGKVHNELASLLKLDASEIVPDQNLMSYGLDSIGAMMLINKVNDLLGLSVQPAALLQHPTLNGFVNHIVTEHLKVLPEDEIKLTESALDPFIAGLVEEAESQDEPVFLPRDPFLGELTLEELTQVGESSLTSHSQNDGKNIATLTAESHSTEPFLLTCGQQALWFLNQFSPDSSAYHIAITFRIRDILDQAAFAAAYQDILTRHDVLRMSFDDTQGEPQQILRQEVNADIEFADLPGHITDEGLRQRLRDSYNQPFNLKTDALSRMRVLTTKGQGSVILWVVHHIVADAWSVWVLLDELLACYQARLAGRSLSWTPITATLSDFARDEMAFLSSDAGEKQLAFWQQQLSAEPALLNLPIDYPRPKVQSFEGKSLPFVCDQTLSERIRDLALKNEVTPFTLLLSAYQAFLCRWSNCTRVWVGSPVSGRIEQRYMTSVGNFINSVVLTADISDMPTFSALLQRQQKTVALALENQRYPFSRLVERLNPKREGGRTPLFQAEFLFQKSHQSDDLIRILSPLKPAEIVHKGVRLESLPFTQQEGQFDIALEMMDMDEHFMGSFKFNAGLFSSSTMTRIQRSFIRFITACVVSPDQPIPRLSQEPFVGEHVMLSGLEFALPSLTMTDLFEQQVTAQRMKQAIAYQGESMTYDSLNRRANQIARCLCEAGLEMGQYVAVCLPRSIDLVATLLGVIKAGGAYIPIDPSFPAERIRFMLEDACPALLVTQGSLTFAEDCIPRQTQRIDLAEKEVAIASSHDANLGRRLGAEDTAYVIFTSGSTGRPKGVRIPHRSLTNFLLSMQDTPGMQTSDRLLAVTTISFDIAALELFLPLVTGATVIVASRSEARDGLALKQLLARHDITVMQATPVTWQMLLEAGWQGKDNLKVLCGGEAMPGRLAADLQQRTASVWNLYGPTETTIWSCIHPIQGDYGEQAVPIGTPIYNTKVCILDSALAPVPVGEIGQLYIGGLGVALGYLDRDELTRERFIDIAGETFYCTGDCVRLMDDGVMTFHGREDQQVKINGFRIETGEIEHHLKSWQAISDCVVCVENGPAEPMLVAYVIPSGGAVPLTPDAQEALRNHLNQLLPSYMVPGVFRSVSAFPLTPNNKIDRKRLPQVALADNPTVTLGETNNIAFPARIQALWRDVLQRETEDTNSHFFNAGGSSLKATRLIYRISEEFSITPPVSLLFEHPVLTEFTNALGKYLPNGNQSKKTEESLFQENAHIVPETGEEKDIRLLRILAQLSGGDISIDQAQQMMEDQV